jgi:hypothetical protein
MSPFGKDETPVGTILPFTLHVTGSIPHGDIHTSLGYEPSPQDSILISTLLLLLLSLRL